MSTSRGARLRQILKRNEEAQLRANPMARKSGRTIRREVEIERLKAKVAGGKVRKVKEQKPRTTAPKGKSKSPKGQKEE